MKDSLLDQILLQLYYSIDYGFSYKAKKGLFILDEFPHKWEKIDQKQIQDGIRDLNKQKLVKKKKNYDGSVVVSLTDKGKLRVLNARFKNFYNRKEKWDGKWRMVAFDIPDEYKKGRNALRYRLRLGGFYELQESLFLYPYDCQKEIDDFIKLFKLERHVRFALLEFIDNEKDIKIAMGID